MKSDDIAEALKARVTEYTKRKTFDLDEASKEASLPVEYVELHLARRMIDNPQRVGGTSEANGWRLSTRAVAKSLSNARLLEDNVRAAFHRNPVELAGEMVDVRYESGGGDFETDDEGYYAALTDRIFVR